MKPDTMKSDTTELARDESGRLYSVRMRQLVDPSKVDIGIVEAIGAVRMAGRMIHHLQERWAEKHDLSEGRLGVLFRLFKCGPTPLGDLASDLDSTPRNITGLVDHLERHGLVERVPDSDDRRSVHARLTEAGRTQIESIWQEALTHQEKLVAGMTKEELAQLRHLCLHLVQNARKELGK
ncbi:MAG: MarR family transcriptional regulator [Candidatus Dormibacteraceae bacterium]